MSLFKEPAKSHYRRVRIKMSIVFNYSEHSLNSIYFQYPDDSNAAGKCQITIAGHRQL